MTRTVLIVDDEKAIVDILAESNFISSKRSGVETIHVPVSGVCSSMLKLLGVFLK